jgi:DNA-binding NarL/FixJ family response regulator
MMAPGKDALDVLIVDDAEDFRELLRLSLAGNARVNIVGEATNGEEALTEAAARHTDVVILDLSMPVMDGLEAAPLITQANPEVKIVVLSAFRASDMATKAFAAGADAYVEKSAILGEMESTTFAVVDGTAASDPTHREP